MEPKKANYLPDGAHALLTRQQLGQTQQQLAHSAKLSLRTIRKIEGEAVSANTLQAVALILGIDWHDLLTNAEKNRLRLDTGTNPAPTPSATTQTVGTADDKPPSHTDSDPPTDAEAESPASGEPEDAILILIDVFGYTPQANEAGDAATQRFDKYLKGELRKRARPHKVHWIKSIGDAALLWCRRPGGLVEFALELFFRKPIPPHAGFAPSFRMQRPGCEAYALGVGQCM